MRVQDIVGIRVPFRVRRDDNFAELTARVVAALVGYVDLALMVYDSENDPEAKLVGEGPAIHHFGIEVEGRQEFIDKIQANGGTLLSKPDSGTVKFRSPDGTIAELVDVGRYEKMREEPR